MIELTPQEKAMIIKEEFAKQEEIERADAQKRMLMLTPAEKTEILNEFYSNPYTIVEDQDIHYPDKRSGISFVLALIVFLIILEFWGFIAALVSSVILGLLEPAMTGKCYRYRLRCKCPLCDGESDLTIDSGLGKELKNNGFVYLTCDKCQKKYKLICEKLQGVSDLGN